jgi:hypothetical protein
MRSQAAKAGEKSSCAESRPADAGFMVTERDQGKPWIVVGGERRTARLEDEAQFFAWAAERWPTSR